MAEHGSRIPERRPVCGFRAVGDRERGSVALLALLGGGLALVVVLVPVVVLTDLVVTRGRAQLAADAAALAAMDAAGGRTEASRVAAANGGRLRSCCGDDPWRREVTVDVPPASLLLSAMVPSVRASAAASLVAAQPPMAASVGGALPGPGARTWPLRGPLTSRFGMRTHPLSGASRLHAGIDIGVASGTPIGAAAAGTVVAAGAMGGYGNTVDVHHGDGVVTRYAHQSRVFVRPGQRVVAGQIIGLVGSTGASTGPHLHFEVRTPAGPVDPLTWLPH